MRLTCRFHYSVGITQCQEKPVDFTTQ